jgi:hypothetical protein
MLKIISDGENRFRLESASGADIGWIRGRTIGFRGLPNESAAIRAGVAASHALESALGRQYPGRPVPDIRTDGIRLAHDGAYEWIADGNRPLARVLRPAPPPYEDDSFGIELQVPSYATHHVTITSANAVWKVVGPLLGADEPVAHELKPSAVFPFRRGPSRAPLEVGA